MASDLLIRLLLRDEATKQITTLEGKITHLNNSARQMWNAIGSSAVVAGAISFMKQAIDAASEQEMAIQKLSIAVENSGQSWASSRDQILSFTAALSRATTYSDNETIKTFQRLISYTGDIDKTMQGTKLAMDIASSGFLDLETASNAVGKAIEGDIQQLGKLIPELKAAQNHNILLMTASERSAYALDLLQKKFGGMAEGEVDTFRGAMKQLNNSWDEFLRSIGDFTIKSPEAISGIHSMSLAIQALTENIDKLRANPGGKSIFEDVVGAIFGMGTGSFNGLIGLGSKLGMMAVGANNNATDLGTIDVTGGGGGGWGNESGAGLTSKTVENEQEKVNRLREIWSTWNAEKTAMEMARLQAETEFFNLAIDAQKKAHESMWTAIGQMRTVFAQDMSKLFVDMMKGVADVKKFFQELGWKMVEILVNWAVQKAVNWALAQALLSAEIATASAAASAIAAAWAPAAAMASLATLGGNSGPASAALAGTTAFAYALSIPKLAEGGIVNRPTLAMIGERGPEAVVPLNKTGGLSRIINVNISLAGALLATEEVAERYANLITEHVSRNLAFEAERIR